MDNLIPETDETNPNEPTNITPPAKPAKKIRPMPEIEGITAPRINTPRVITKPSGKTPMTPDEVFKGGDSRIVLPSMTQKSHPVRNFLIFLILLAGLSYGGFIAYQKYWPEETGNEPTTNQVSTENENDRLTFNEPDVSSNTPAVLPEPATTTPATTTPPVVAGATTTPTGPQLKVNNNSLGYLNVRSEPAVSGKILTKVYPGEQYSYTTSKFDWYQITLPSGQTGWVSGQYITAIK